MASNGKGVDVRGEVVNLLVEKVGRVRGQDGVNGGSELSVFVAPKAGDYGLSGLTSFWREECGSPVSVAGHISHNRSEGFMTRADQHHEQCRARQTTEDDCRCSWLIDLSLPREERYLLSPDEAREAWLRLEMEYEDPLQDRQT
jgi:hypothetical protein